MRNTGIMLQGLMPHSNEHQVKILKGDPTKKQNKTKNCYKISTISQMNMEVDELFQFRFQTNLDFCLTLKGLFSSATG